MHPLDTTTITTSCPVLPTPAPWGTGARLGLSSLILSVLAGLAMLVCFVVAGVLEMSDVGADEVSLLIELLGVGMVLLMFAQMVAAGLGIAALTQPNHQPVLAVLGTVFSGSALFMTVLLMLIGGVFESM